MKDYAKLEDKISVKPPQPRKVEDKISVKPPQPRKVERNIDLVFTVIWVSFIVGVGLITYANS